MSRRSPARSTAPRKPAKADRKRGGTVRDASPRPGAAPAPSTAAQRGRRSTGSVTLEDVAKIAGVSPITVSRVVNRPELVRPETVEHVQRVIARTGYVPNLLAGGLASRRSRLVAAIVPTVANSIFIEVIQSLTDVLWAARYQVVLALSGYGTGQAASGYGPREETLVTAILSRRPDAMFIVGVNHSAESRRRILAARIPVVEAWDLTTNPLDMVIGFSHEGAGTAVAEFVAGKGYRRIGLVSADDERATRRKLGFEATLAKLGVPPPVTVVRPAPSTLRSGREALAALLDQGFRPEVVVCSSDAFAHGVLAEALSRGISVPRDLAVVGFGDLEFAANTVPALTTVRIDRAAIGRLSAEALLERMQGKPLRERIVDVGFQIVERATT
jgi:LacI family gluconate utilization system Gnt-I transcriptional repressor